MLILSILFMFGVQAQIQVDVAVNKANYLLEQVLPSNYQVEIYEDEEKGFRIKEKATAILFKDQSKNMLIDNLENMDESTIIIQTGKTLKWPWIVTAVKDGVDWKIHRYTDEGRGSRNLSVCETKKGSGFFSSDPDLDCIFASERICNNTPLTQWPQKESPVTKEKFRDFYGGEVRGTDNSAEGIKKYLRAGNRHHRKLKKIFEDEYKVKGINAVRNRIKQAYEMDEGPEGDKERGEVMTQVKILCSKAWSHHQMTPKGVPANRSEGGASGLQETNTGVR